VAALSGSRTRAAALLSGLLLGCASPVTVEESPGPGAGVRIDRIALAPLQVDPAAKEVESDAASVIGSRLVEALAAQHDVGYVSPDEVALWLDQRGLPVADTAAQRVGGELARAFGADAVLFGVVRRYRSRVGGPHGAVRPAAVWFDVELRLPSGERIWNATYHEEQKPLSDDLFQLPRAAQRGFEWLDAPALASEGARELVRALLAERSTWR
jgi:hypothetical protein